MPETSVVNGKITHAQVNDLVVLQVTRLSPRRDDRDLEGEDPKSDKVGVIEHRRDLKDTVLAALRQIARHHLLQTTAVDHAQRPETRKSRGALDVARNPPRLEKTA